MDGPTIKLIPNRYKNNNIEQSNSERIERTNIKYEQTQLQKQMAIFKEKIEKSRNSII